ncbi:unnamed protein product, partial [Tetraodon nigroviridis]
RRWAWAVTQKNALVHLNELRPGLSYHVTSRSGPLHAPLFAVGVDVNGVRFEGRGPTVKRAKLRAAELALRSFVQFPNASQALATMGNLGSTFTDFAGAEEPDPPGPLKEAEGGPHVHLPGGQSSQEAHQEVRHGPQGGGEGVRGLREHKRAAKAQAAAAAWSPSTTSAWDLRARCWVSTATAPHTSSLR